MVISRHAKWTLDATGRRDSVPAVAPRTADEETNHMPIAITKPKPRPPRLLVYGPPGVGKTTFAAGLPNPVLIPCEDGAGTIAVAQTPQPGCWAELVAIIDALLDDLQGFRSLIIDSTTAAQEMLFQHICMEEKAASIELAAGGYGKGYVRAAETWRVLLSKLDALRARGMTICLLAHACTQKHEDPRLPPYDRLSPRLHATAKGAGIGPMTIEWCDLVGCAAYDIAVADGKGYGDGQRLLYLQERPAFLAKNRYRLPESMPLDPSSMMAAIRAAVAPNPAEKAPTAEEQNP
jgi:DNA polymerase III delta prime subunit